MRGRLEGLGPVTARRARRAARARRPPEIEAALARLEAEGFGDARPVHAGRARDRVVRAAAARAHPPLHAGPAARARSSRSRRATSCASSSAGSASRPRRASKGADALAAIVAQLEGFEAPAAAWETEILPARVNEYDPAWLDELCLAGRVVWTRLAAPRPNGERAPAPVRTTPIALARPPQPRRCGPRSRADGRRTRRSPRARSAVADFLARTALVLRRDRRGTGLLAHAGRGGARRAGRARARELRQLRRACARCSCRPTAGDRSAARRGAGARRSSASRTPGAGRSCGAKSPRRRASPRSSSTSPAPCSSATASSSGACSSAKRRGCRRGATCCAPRRLEARGEIRGGRFVAGVSGEQFALPEAVGLLRDVRREERTGALVSLSGADPLNLVGILTPGARLPALTGNRVLYRDGVPIALLAGGEVRFLEKLAPAGRVERAQRAAAPAGAGGAAVSRLTRRYPQRRVLAARKALRTSRSIR